MLIILATNQKKPKNKKNNEDLVGEKIRYFTEVHENAIIRYSCSEDMGEKTKLYVEYIEPAFNEMIDKIIYTYKFTSLPNISSLKEECKIWLMTILNKYDVKKGFKAFSYFSVITKNWFIHKVKKKAQQNKREVSYDELLRELEILNVDVVGHSYVENRELEEFWRYLSLDMSKWNISKVSEKKVLDSIKVLFDNFEEVEIFNKKAIYLYLRELTGMNTKQIVNNLNKIRLRYRVFRKKWNNGEI
jgi:hypothetical protein